MAKQKKKKTKNIKPFDEQDTRLAGGFVKRIEDLRDMSEADYDKGIKIIKDTSQGRRDRLRRMKNFHRYMFPPV